LLDGKPVGVRFECVKKQPFLTDFPLTVFATARRRLQAAIRNASAIITRSSLSGYSVNGVSKWGLNGVSPRILTFSIIRPVGNWANQPALLGS